MGIIKDIQMLAHKGKLKLRPLKAHIKREGIVDHVKPFVHISINGGKDEWKSDHKHGHNVEWGHDGHWDHHVHHLDHIIEIKMMDHEGLLNNEPIGHFKDEVKHMGHVAAEVVMHVHFDRD